MNRHYAVVLVLLLTASVGNAADEGKVEAIDLVWSGHRVLFDFVGQGSHQVVAYYDASRQMSVAYRASPRSTWRYQKLPSYLGWDSHNAVVVGIDEAGYIHVTGNMHADPLVYFRSTRPFDVRTLKQEATMVGGEETTDDFFFLRTISNITTTTTAPAEPITINITGSTPPSE